MVHVTRADARRINSHRSARARAIDDNLRAEKAKNPEQWARAPNEYDLSGIDDRKVNPHRMKTRKRKYDVLPIVDSKPIIKERVADFVRENQGVYPDNIEIEFTRGATGYIGMASTRFDKSTGKPTYFKLKMPESWDYAFTADPEKADPMLDFVIGHELGHLQQYGLGRARFMTMSNLGRVAHGYSGGVSSDFVEKDADFRALGATGYGVDDEKNFIQGVWNQGSKLRSDVDFMGRMAKSFQSLNPANWGSGNKGDTLKRMAGYMRSDKAKGFFKDFGKAFNLDLDL